MSDLLPVKARENEIVAVSLPCGGCVVMEQTASQTGDRHQVKITITLPDTADLRLGVNGEVLLLGDE